MCCNAENTGSKKSQKIAICAPSHNFVGLYLRSGGMYRQPEKNLLNSSISSTCFHNMVNFRPLTADRFGSLGHHSKFQRVSRLGSITTATSLNGSQPNFARCVAVSWAFRGFLPHYGILPGAKFTLHPPSLALSYFGSVTARHLSSGREPNFALSSTGCHLYLAGRPSRWALAHILVAFVFHCIIECCFELSLHVVHFVNS